MRSLKNLANLANDWLDPNTDSVEGLKRFMMTWYVLKFQTTYKDPVLLSHTLAELVHLYYVYALSENPELLEEINGTKKAEHEAHEDWLKEQMGDDYVSEEEMLRQMEEFENQEKALASDLPETITTDFTSIGPDDE